jgi:methionyl-tRNA formyltransferase
MGTPNIAVLTLKELINSEFKPILVISQTDKAKGRNLKIEPTPVKQIALENNIEVFQPENINDTESIKYLKGFNPELFITFAYGNFLSRSLRQIAKYGAINIHPSILPYHRGADPIRSTILNGDEYTGVSIFKLNNKMDAGDIISQEKFLIDNEPSFYELEDYLSRKCSAMIIPVIKKLECLNRDGLSKQDNSIATYTKKIDRGDLIANFELNAVEFLRRMRAYCYEPGYYCYYKGKKLKIYKGKRLSEVGNVSHGTIANIIKNVGFTIYLKDSEILITEVQQEGKKIMPAYEFCKGSRLNIGEELKNA